ncbi:MAG: alkaline shock response membrane anchor protein AmaP [Candidatus Auribacterota bacterium]
MYRFVRFLFHAFFTLFVLACGISLLCLFFEYPYPFEVAQENITVFLENNLLVLVAGSALAFIAILYLVISFPCKRRETFLRYNTSEGEILISLFAVEDFIRKIARTFREIKDSYPSVTLKGKDSIEINVKLKIWAGVNNLPIAIEDLQKEIRQQIQSCLGIENIIAIHIFLAKDSFAPRDIPIKKRSISPEPLPQTAPQTAVAAKPSQYTSYQNDSDVSEDTGEVEANKEENVY